jgi:hypothetical protein
VLDKRLKKEKVPIQLERIQTAANACGDYARKLFLESGAFAEKHKGGAIIQHAD